MNYGIKVSKPGYNVLSAGDQNLVYTSKYNTIRVALTGSGSVTSDATNPTLVTIAHSLGYVPAFVWYTEVGTPFAVSGHFYLAPFTHPVGGDSSIVAYADSTNIYCRYGAVFAPSGTVANYKYYVFLNQL